MIISYISNAFTRAKNYFSNLFGFSTPKTLGNMSAPLTNTGLTNSILMIRPVSFDLNEETVGSNAFQTAVRSETRQEIRDKALKEFDTFVDKLRAVGINVIVINDTPDPFTPDSIFPNNWVSFHNDGTVITYPMEAKNRRLERRQDIIDSLQTTYGFAVTAQKSLVEPHETNRQFLEGTGSLVLDRKRKQAYACLSSRTHAEALKAWCALTGYTAISFNSCDANGKAIYHTNVVMCMGDKFCVVCLDSINDPIERQQVQAALFAAGKDVLPISYEQMNLFAGNMLQLQNDKGERVLALSQAAYNCLDEQQIEILQCYNTHLVTGHIPIIEKYGGGSTRCMMAEIFLPKS